MNQKERFNHLQRIVILDYLKKYNYIQVTYIIKEYLINRITNFR